MFQLTKIRSWNMNVDNLEESVRFYQELLGAEVSRREVLNGADVVRMRVGDVGVGLFDGSDGPRPGVPHHTFDIQGPEEPETLITEIEAKGFSVDRVRPHEPGQGYSVYVIDPSGNWIELSKNT